MWLLHMKCVLSNHKLQWNVENGLPDRDCPVRVDTSIATGGVCDDADGKGACLRPIQQFIQVAGVSRRLDSGRTRHGP